MIKSGMMLQARNGMATPAATNVRRFILQSLRTGKAVASVMSAFHPLLPLAPGCATAGLGAEPLGYRREAAGLFSNGQARANLRGHQHGYYARLRRAFCSDVAAAGTAGATEPVDLRADCSAPGNSSAVGTTSRRSAALHSAAAGAPVRQLPPRQSSPRQGASSSHGESSPQRASPCDQAPTCHPSGRAYLKAHDPTLSRHDLPSNHEAQHLP